MDMAGENRRQDPRSRPRRLSSDSTSPKAPISADTHETTWTPSPQHSTADPAKPSTGRPPPKPSTNTYTLSNKAVLRRPLEPGQYLSVRYTNRLAESQIVASVGSKGDSYDNALAETTIGLYKTELIRNRGPWRDLDHTTFATLEYIDWFNHRRLHRGITPDTTYTTPAEHENQLPSNQPDHTTNRPNNQPSMKPTHTDRGPLAGAGLTHMKPGFLPWHRSVGLFSG